MHKAEGNKAHIWLGSQDGGKQILYKHWCCEAEGNEPKKFREIRPRESKTRSKFIWVHKDKRTEVKICLGPLEDESRSRETNSIEMLVL